MQYFKQVHFQNDLAQTNWISREQDNKADSPVRVRLSKQIKQLDKAYDIQKLFNVIVDRRYFDRKLDVENNRCTNLCKVGGQMQN